MLASSLVWVVPAMTMTDLSVTQNKQAVGRCSHIYNTQIFFPRTVFDTCITRRAAPIALSNLCLRLWHHAWLRVFQPLAGWLCQLCRLPFSEERRLATEQSETAENMRAVHLCSLESSSTCEWWSNHDVDVLSYTDSLFQ